MYRKQRRIPTILALMIILTGIGTAIYFEGNWQNLTSKASQTPQPNEVHLTNISDNSFTVSYLTDTAKIGSIQVQGPDKNTFILDDRDIDGMARARTTHMFTVSGLQQNSQYKISFTSQKTCNKNKCLLFTQKTGPKLVKSLNLPPISGQIVDKEKRPIDGAIIYLLVGNAAPVSGRSDKSGMYVIPLNNLRSQDLLSRPDLNDESNIQLTVKNTINQYTSVISKLGLIKADNKLPPIEMGKTYNFMGSNKTASKSAQMEVLGNNSVTLSNTGINILFPGKEKDTTIDQNPKLRGVGIPGNKIQITVNSESQTATITVKADGTWEYRPKIPLPPGMHTITLTGTDNSGKKITISRKFVVLKSGEAVLGEATPSGTLTPTEEPNITISPSFTPTPS